VAEDPIELTLLFRGERVPQHKGKGKIMRSTIAIIAVVVGAFSLATCSEPAPGPKGEQGPPGPQGTKGDWARQPVLQPAKVQESLIKWTLLALKPNL
jgi:hypothetical protein